MSIAAEKLPRPLKKEATAPRWFIKITYYPAAATIFSKTCRYRDDFFKNLPRPRRHGHLWYEFPFLGTKPETDTPRIYSLIYSPQIMQ
jgi:hypothetical protein